MSIPPGVIFVPEPPSHPDYLRIRERCLKFIEQEQLNAWIDELNPLFSGRTPREVIEAGEGLLIDRAIDDLERGIYR